MNRWTLNDVADVVKREQPGGLTDLWNHVPPGYALPADARAVVVRSYQDAVAQGIALFQQKAVAFAGVSVGFRPEVFEALRGLPGIDVVAETALAALRDGLDMGKLNAAAQKVLTKVITYVGDRMGASLAMADYAGAMGAVVAIVWGAIETIVNAENEWKEYREAQKLAALDCAPPSYSAATDRDFAQAAVELLGTPNWSDLFLPTVNPTNGFTCCISAVDGGRVIAPVGLGIGNRVQSAFTPGGGWAGDWQPDYYGSGLGYGCLPMLPNYPVHRAIVIPNGRSHQTYDPSWSLVQLGAVAIEAYTMLHGLGPATYTVDGDDIASAWSHYLATMRDQIARNAPGFGTSSWGEGVCDDWGLDGRMRALGWLWDRLYLGKVPADAFGGGRGDGIFLFEDSVPVSHWRSFAKIQGALLGYDPDSGQKAGPPRLVAAYVDSHTCHPAWRQRIRQAQQELLELGDAVCRMDVTSIPDPEYRSAVEALRRQKGVPCLSWGLTVSADFRVSATDGPSLEPLGEGSPPIPKIPIFPAPPRAQSVPAAPRRSSKAPLVMGATVLGGLGLLLLRRR